MADLDTQPPSTNVFDQFDEASGQKPETGGPATPAMPNAFDQFDEPGSKPIGAPQTTTGGAFRRSAQRSVVPAAGGLIGAGAGAETGAALGLLGGPFAPITVPVAGFLGGVGGFFAGSWVAESAQHYALKQAPDSWTDALGMSDRQARLDEAQHPTASFLGGLTPYAMTMRPGGLARSALPENATAMQRIIANPVTARVFGGATMGGLELGQEALNGEVDWRNVAIATGFGVVWNKPTKLGMSITEAGAAPMRALGGAIRDLDFPHRITRPPGEREPITVAQAGDARVIGPGVTEDVFQGSHQQDPHAEMVAQETARTEALVTGQPEAIGPSVHDVARRIEPDTFDQYDRLSQQREQFREWLSEHQNPTTEGLEGLRTQREELEKEMLSQPRTGTEVRHYMAQLRDLEQQYQAALERRQSFLEGRGQETPEAAQVRQRLMAVDEQMRDMAPQVSAAYRRAADALGSGTVPEAPRPVPEAPPAPPAAAPAAQPIPAPLAAPPGPAGAQAVDIAQGKGGIVADVFRQLIAAGRPVEEARAAATLVAERYATRAARFKGALGTPEELYGREGAQITGVSGAQKTAPARAASAQPAAEVSPETPAFPKGYEDWTPGTEVAVGPIKQLTVVEARPDGFTLRSKQGQTFEFTPPEKTPKEKTGLEMLEHLREVTAPMELAQRRELEQRRGRQLGAIYLAENARPVIRLARDADASSFIHEEGHDFFEQIMRDAEHPQAPPEVKDDAQTLYDALKVNGRGEVKTRHHEHIARWFEQYMREGRAPSTALARVFEQFKGWLTQIYQTIKGLGVPISNDIRSVFDRMLAEEPQRTVIAPERAEGPTLSDIHKTDAATTEPAQAEPAMDRVVSETQQAETALPPEVKDEIQSVLPKVEAAIEPRTETGAGTETAGGVGDGSERSSAQPGGGRSGEGTGSVVGSGGKAGPEGSSVPAGFSGPRPGAVAEPPLGPRPADTFGPEQSPFVDKAGNIRLENLTNLEDVRQAIRDAAEANDDFIGDRQGVVTDQQVDDLARAAGMEGAEKLVAGRIKGQAFNAVEVMTLRRALIQSATEVNAAMKKVAGPGSTDADVLAYAEVRDRHHLLQATVAQATAEAGRALRAFRNISEEAGGVDEYLRSATGRTLYQIREEAKLGAQLDTPEKVSKYLLDAQKPTFGRMILEFWINNLISGPATHTTYMIGNTILSMQKMGPETAAAALIGHLREMGGRPGETVRMGEVGAQIRGIAKGLSPALKASVESLRAGVTALLPGETRRMAMPFQPGAEMAAPPLLDEAARVGDVMASVFGLMRGMRDGIMSTGQILKGGIEGAPLIGTEYSPLGAIPDLQVKGVTVLPLGQAVRLPSRFIAAIHTFFRATNYSVEKSALAYRMASNEGLSGTAFDARVGQIWQNPTPDVMSQSRSQATDLAMMGQGSKFTQALSRLTNTEVFGFPILKFIDPFVHISSNVIDQSIIKRTPIGLFSPELRADLSGRNGNIAQDRAQARMLVGTAFAMTIGGLAAEGFASGSGPSDPREAAMWRLAGNQAHSVRVGDIWYDTHRLGPVGMLMGIGADMYEVAHLANEGEFTKAAAHLQHAITQNVLDESFMRGPSDLIRAIEDPGRYGEAYVRNFLSSFVPYSVGLSQEARAVDPYSREARTIVDAMRAKVPYMSMGLLPRRDIWGDPIPNRDALIAPGVTAIYMQHISNDPVNMALVELGIHPAAVERKIRNVELTAVQHDQFAQIAGRMAKMRLDVIVRSPDWQQWNPQIRRDVIQETIRQSREVARGKIMAQDPTIIERATRAKLDKMRQ